MSNPAKTALEGAAAERCRRALILAGLLLGPAALPAADGVRFGLQVGAAAPVSPDLELTTGSGFNPTVGLRLEWEWGKNWGFRDHDALRLRLDAGRFREGRQVSDAPGLHQEIATKVRDESLGLEQLYYVDRWYLGVGAYAVRWTVDATNRLVTPDGEFTTTSSSHWTRLGLGLVAGHRWTEHAEVELRFVASHYGQEDQPARVVSLNFLLSF